MIADRKFIGTALLATVVMTACAAEDKGNVIPVAASDELETLDEGSSWDGWSNSASWVQDNFGRDDWYVTFTRSYGDSTRGGGACLVWRDMSSSCSSDASCTSDARDIWGSEAWGYCYQGKCAYRPGGTTLCYRNPNNAPGTYTNEANRAFANTGTAIPSSRQPYCWPGVLTCMTKSAGPNTSCGDTGSSSGYVRSVTDLQYFYLNG